MFVQPSEVQRAVVPSSTASGLEVPDTHTSRHTFSPISFPIQRVTAPSSVASSLANLDNKISPESSPIFFTPPTSQFFFTPPTSPVDFVLQSPAIPTFNSHVDTGNGTHSVTVDVEFSATPVCSSGSASKGKRGLGFKIEQTCSAFTPIASRPIHTVSSSPASCTAQTSTTSDSPSSIVSRPVSAVVNRPTVRRNVISTSALNPRAPIFRPRTKLCFDVHHPRVISSSSQLTTKKDPNNTACEIAATRCDAFFGEAIGFHPPRPPDSSTDDDAEVYHPSRPPEFYSDTEETLLKEHSIFQPQMSPYCLPSVHSVETPDTTQDFSVPPHLQALFDTTLETIELSESNKRKLASVLQRNSCAFATDPLDLGYCDVLHHDIDTGNSLPIKQSPRRPPISAREAEDNILDEMLKTGVIEPSNSPWSSPVCLVKKRDETYRFCIDYRRVNDVTKKDAHPLPDSKDALDSLKGARYYATVDLLNGYWQLPMTERAKDRSAFCTRRELFQFTRMPFGLANAPSTFCRRMQIVLSDLLYTQCLCFLDDIIIFADDPEQLIDRLDTVFTRLRECGLKAKPSKCVFFKSPINFLGHLVSESGIQPQPEKLEAIKNWLTPHCLRDVRAFYGLASYYRKFVKDFAAIAEPLSRLTKKNTTFVWTDEAQESFDKLKSALLATEILAYPRPDLPCLLDSDASDISVGAVLSQTINGIEKPIAFFSKVLNEAQRNYCPTRRELLAVVLSLQHFRNYLLGAKVILRTDHHSLKWLKTFKRPEGILARWLETLAEYDYTIEHRPGRLHSNADALSRQRCKQCWGKVANSS